MFINSFKVRSFVFGAVLTVSATYAVASAYPINPMPPVPGNGVVASAYPINPMPPVPGNGVIARVTILS